MKGVKLSNAIVSDVSTVLYDNSIKRDTHRKEIDRHLNILIINLHNNYQMTPSQVFSYAGMIAMPMWLLMIFLPKWKVTKILIDYKVIPLALGLIYAVYIIKGIVFWVA